MVLLKVSPWKGVIRFRKRGKLGPHYIGSFRIIAKVIKVAYRLELPEELNRIHNTFHVSQLRKCIMDQEAVVSLDDIQVDERLNYVERPVAILERKKKIMLNEKKYFWSRYSGRIGGDPSGHGSRRWRYASITRHCLFQRTPRTKSSSSGGTPRFSGIG